VLQKQSSEQKVAVVELIQRVLGYSELADIVFALMEVCFWPHLKESVFYIETNILEFGGDVEDTLFEMRPEAYLHQGKDDIC
jgi:hypothetical protein